MAKSPSWDRGWVALGAFSSLVVCFLVVPVLLVAGFAINSANYLAFPPSSISLRWFQNFFASQSYMKALVLSLGVAAISVAVAVCLGVTAALAIVRGSIPGSAALTGLFMSPLMLPTILTGLGLFQVYYYLDLGRPLWGLVAGHVVICTPYIIRTTVAMLTNFDRSIEEAALTLGASPTRTFFETTLPLIRPGVIAGAIFAFIISFDQFPLSLFLVAPGNETLPILLFNQLKFEFDPTVAAASTVSIAISVALILIIEWTIGLNTYIRL